MRKTSSITCWALLALVIAALTFSCERKCCDNGQLRDPYRRGYHVIRDYQYLYNHYFDLRPRPSLYPAGTKLPTDLLPSDSIIKLELYFQTDEEYATACTLYVDPVSRDSFPERALVRRYFDEEEFEAEKLQEVSYFYHPTEHYIRVDSPSLNRSNFSVGVYLEVIRGDSVVTIGDVSSPDAKVLKMLRHENPQPPYITWNYVWRNVYFLGGSISRADSVYVDIFKGDAISYSQMDGSDTKYLNGETYLHLLGLDSDNNGVIDMAAQTLDVVNGLLFFPDRRPFLNPALSADTVPELYSEPPSSSVIRDSSRFFLLVQTAEYMWDE